MSVEEKDAIREVLAEYCFALDNYRFSDMAALFTEDGIWDTAFGKATGREAIAAQANRISDPPAQRQRRIHMMANILIKLAGEDAQVMSNWEMLQNGEQGPHVSSAGAYDDRMVKRDGRWLFQIRKIDRFIK